MSEIGSGPDRPGEAGGASPAGGTASLGGRGLRATLDEVAIVEDDEFDAVGDVGDAGDDLVDDADERPDWAWVEEWQESGEPPAWAPGITLAVFVAILVGLAIFVLSDGLAGIPWLAVVANVLVAAGLTPALWLSRRLPVLRWIAAGAAVGVVVGWIAALVS